MGRKKTTVEITAAVTENATVEKMELFIDKG